MARLSDAETALDDVSFPAAEDAQEAARRLEANLAAFARYLPDLAAHFAHYRPLRQLVFVAAEDGWDLKHGDGLFYGGRPYDACRAQIAAQLEAASVHLTLYRPVADYYGQLHHRYLKSMYRAARMREPLTLRATDLPCLPHAVMLGCGLGVQLSCLTEAARVLNLIIIEPDTDLFYASLMVFDWAGFLERCDAAGTGLNFLVGQDQSEVLRDMAGFYERHGRFLSAFLALFVHYDSDKVRAILGSLRGGYFQNFSALSFFDDQIFGLCHALSAVSSGRRFLRGGWQLPADLRDIPAFVVANGPSLDQDLSFLRRIQDRSVLFACGTALDTLYTAGVRPDFYCALERVPAVLAALRYIPDRTYLRSITLVCTEAAPPELYKLFGSSVIITRAEESFAQICAGHPGARGVAVSGTLGPLVANLGLEAAVRLGFRRIFLCGTDCGYRDAGGEAHASGNSFYAHNRSRKVTRGLSLLSSLHPVAGNFGGTVLSGQVFDLSRLVMSECLRLASGSCVCVNLSDGAQIPGAAACHAADLEPELAKKPPHPGFKAQLKALLLGPGTVTPDPGDLSSTLSPGEYARIADRIIALLTKAQSADREGVIRILELGCEFLSSLKVHPDYALRALWLRGSLETFFIMITHQLFHSQDPEVCLRAARRCLELCGYFLEDTRRVVALIPEYTVGYHRVLMHARTGWDHPGAPAPKMHSRRLQFRRPPRRNRVFVKRTA